MFVYIFCRLHGRGHSLYYVGEPRSNLGSREREREGKEKRKFHPHSCDYRKENDYVREREKEKKKIPSAFL